MGMSIGVELIWWFGVAGAALAAHLLTKITLATCTFLGSGVLWMAWLGHEFFILHFQEWSVPWMPFLMSLIGFVGMWAIANPSEARRLFGPR